LYGAWLLNRVGVAVMEVAIDRQHTEIQTLRRELDGRSEEGLERELAEVKFILSMLLHQVGGEAILHPDALRGLPTRLVAVEQSKKTGVVRLRLMGPEDHQFQEAAETRPMARQGAALTRGTRDPRRPREGRRRR